MLRAVLREIKGYWKTTWKNIGYSKVLFNVHRGSPSNFTQSQTKISLVVKVFWVNFTK